MSIEKASEARPDLLLRRVRQDHGWSQKELADLIDANHIFIYNRRGNGTAIPVPHYRQKLNILLQKSFQGSGFIKRPFESDLVNARVSMYDPPISFRFSNIQASVGRDNLLADSLHQLCSETPERLIALYGLPEGGKATLVPVWFQ